MSAVFATEQATEILVATIMNEDYMPERLRAKFAEDETNKQNGGQE